MMRSTLHTIYMDLCVENMMMFTGEEINAAPTFLVFLNGLIFGVHQRPKH